MSFDDPAEAPVTVSRATFLAVAAVVIGLVFVGVAATGTVGSPSPASPWVISGLGWLVIAVFVRLRPDTIDRGREPAPRVWFEYGAVVGAVLVVTLLVGLALL
jgi:hypothetical protein